MGKKEIIPTPEQTAAIERWEVIALQVYRSMIYGDDDAMLLLAKEAGETALPLVTDDRARRQIEACLAAIEGFMREREAGR
ncbi:hypothetical protein I6F35_38150 [Bradyrhizobium sp. BRP22]|uniref:hypothetical protein n=1 Tax=Bradyrhizobium sp. BRP22 TaxID=2793821 RepID=UPI001CD69FC5|nr:hypothetical protein [Bradyrhizobium sp. BRP22]MCA1458887.1 hypothetical protein [Bradyrhizobium sp. BRP22]